MKKAVLALALCLGLLSMRVDAGWGDNKKAAAPTQKNETIVQIAQANPQFTTLVMALKEANLVGALSEKGPFTVFAPTDEAFAKLPEGTLKNLLKPENRDQLKAVLTYHVVPGKVLSSDLKTMEVETLNSAKLAIVVNGSKVTVNGIEVVKADIEGSNGVIHVIDGVLIPPQK